jgi:hypothetical protein
VRTLSTIAATLCIVAAPVTLRPDDVFDASDRMGWVGMANAIARVRFEAQSAMPGDLPRTRHTAIVLGIFKGHERLRRAPERVEVIERQGFMQTEDGDYPCWDNEQPLPEGTEALAFLVWDTDLHGFLLGTVASVQSGERRLRMRSSISRCDSSDKM